MFHVEQQRLTGLRLAFRFHVEHARYHKLDFLPNFVNE